MDIQRPPSPSKSRATRYYQQILRKASGSAPAQLPRAYSDAHHSNYTKEGGKRRFSVLRCLIYLGLLTGIILLFRGKSSQDLTAQGLKDSAQEATRQVSEKAGQVLSKVKSSLSRNGTEASCPPCPGKVSPQVPVTPGQSNNAETFAMVMLATEATTYAHPSLVNKMDYARRHGYQCAPHFRSLAPKLSPVWSKIPAMKQALEEGWSWAWWLDLDTLVTNLDFKLEDVVNGKALDGVEAEELEKNPDGDPNDLPEPKDKEEERSQRHVLTAGDNGGKPVKRRLKWTMDEIDIIVSNDCNGFNAGSILLRNTEWSKKWLDRVWAMRPNAIHEQDAMKKLFLSDKEVRQKTLVIPQHIINGYPEEIKCQEWDGRGWQPGDFMWHIAGAWAFVDAKKVGKDVYTYMFEKYSPYIQGIRQPDYAAGDKDDDE